MRSTLKLVCPECQQEVETTYVLLGADTICPECKRSVKLQDFVGLVYPNTGYELSFRQFQQLLEEPHCRDVVRGFLNQNLGVNLKYPNDGLAIGSGMSDAIDHLNLHLRIQDDAALQLSLYRLAMSLWR